jgi:2-keto-4-pentenoate hydratase/2-oxohepta-3-ene-1,7-dioic acid hydratase in catechol pathway
MKTIIYQQQTVTPSKVICVGRNYAKHIAELNNQNTGDIVIFMKPNSAICQVLHASQKGCSQAIHYEAELCFIVENGALAGVGFGLDLTKRELQGDLKAKGLPWERAKGFDGSAVFSEFIALSADMTVAGLSIELLINQQLRQKGEVSDMLFSPETVLADVTRFMTFENGDVMMTGTPDGVGVVQQGDEFVGRVFYQDKRLIEMLWIAQ